MEVGKKIKTLAIDVAAVASYGYGEWAVYIKGTYTEGGELIRNHDNAIDIVAGTGDKTSKEVAEALFPEFKNKFRYRS